MINYALRHVFHVVAAAAAAAGQLGTVLEGEGMSLVGVFRCLRRSLIRFFECTVHSAH